jgi:hypothetical protein
MTERNLKNELCYFTYSSREDGETTETIDYECLIGLFGELIDRIDSIETQIKDLQKIAIAHDYMRTYGL